MYKILRHIVVIGLLTLLQHEVYGVEGRPKLRRACLDITDSTITLLWFTPTDNCNSFTWFSLYGREDAFSLYKHMGHYTNFSLNSIQFKIPNIKSWEFYLVYSKACNGVDSIYSDTIMIDNKVPDNSEIDSVSVDLATQKTIIGWRKNASNDVKGYFVYYVTSTNSIIDNTINTFANDINATRDPVTSPQSYGIAAYDSCDNTSLISRTHRTMHLTSVYDQCKKTIDLKWNSYYDSVSPVKPIIGWPVRSYDIYLSINGAAFQRIGNIISNITKFTYSFPAFGDTYCFYVRALESRGSLTSSSNITCISTNSLVAPTNSYIAKVSVQQENVELTLITQVGTSLQKVNIYKSEDNSGFFLWNTVSTTGGTLDLVDNQVKVHTKNYSYYFETEGPCGLIFDKSQTCKTILLNLLMIAPGDQRLNWNEYQLFKKNTDKQELLLINTPIADKRSPWNILNTLPPLILSATDSTNFNSTQEQLCYCVRAIENSPNQFYRRQDTSYSNIECAKADPIVYFPNAIQVNGFNTEFYPQGVFLDYSKSSFQIFNRWGQLVYETSDIRKGWKGVTSAGDLVEDDVYAYRSIIVGINGKQLTFDGTVTVLK